MFPDPPELPEPLFRLNRNILECKFEIIARGATTTTVLIETYWNVNRAVPATLRRPPRLNRNILECKFSGVVDAKESAVVLIETYWNVNYF